MIQQAPMNTDEELPASIKFNSVLYDNLLECVKGHLDICEEATC